MHDLLDGLHGGSAPILELGDGIDDSCFVRHGCKSQLFLFVQMCACKILWVLLFVCESGKSEELFPHVKTAVLIACDKAEPSIRVSKSRLAWEGKYLTMETFKCSCRRALCIRLTNIASQTALATPARARPGVTVTVTSTVQKRTVSMDPVEVAFFQFKFFSSFLFRGRVLYLQNSCSYHEKTGFGSLVAGHHKTNKRSSVPRLASFCIVWHKFSPAKRKEPVVLASFQFW